MKKLSVTDKPSAAPMRDCSENGLDLDPANRFAPTIQGQLLRWSERREVAIYLRRDALWVADFIDGDGQLIDAATWFRFNCATPFTSHARRRMIVESAMPLSGQLAAKIESLHRSATPRARGVLVRLAQVMAAYAPRTRFTGIFRKRLAQRSARRAGPSP